MGDTKPPVIELRDVRASYGTIEVLSGVDLVVPEGQVFALLGPNGGGKSTTLKVISGQVKPSRGEVLIAGHDVTGATPDRLARLGVCTIPEGRGVFPNLTVRENLQVMTLSGYSLGHVEEVAYARFPQLGERPHQLAGTMSGGEQQMLAMARAMATDPAVLLLDELSMGLAPLIVEHLYGEVAAIAESGITVLVLEQFAHAVLGVATTAAIMLNGRITQVGPPAEIEETLSTAYLGGT